MTPKEIAEAAVKALDSKLGENICLIATTKVTVVADYFVIVNGNSNTHVRALADEVEYALSQQGVEATHIEGRATGWILLDYGCVVVHVFTPEAREYYNLEKLWADGEVVDISTFTEN
ncbi:MAG: ribosome silencing factor [Clostridia bacterium]|nr:ribosome silencing factor [Clostridia bacterium]